MPKRPSKGMETLGHCKCYGYPVGAEPSGSPACLSTVPSVTGPECVMGVDWVWSFSFMKRASHCLTCRKIRPL